MARETRRSENNAQPLACDRDPTSITALVGNPLASKAGRTARSIIACAVANASLPILNTQLFPERKTPVASAKTFGRPSKIKATTPNGALTEDTDQPLCSTVSITEPST